jgi:periodic tryptophan protein 2
LSAGYTRRRSAGNLSSGAAFTSLTFSADGSMLFAGGRSKYVCVYDVAEKVLLRRFQVSWHAHQQLD